MDPEVPACGSDVDSTNSAHIGEDKMTLKELHESGKRLKLAFIGR